MDCKECVRDYENRAARMRHEVNESALITDDKESVITIIDKYFPRIPDNEKQKKQEFKL